MKTWKRKLNWWTSPHYIRIQRHLETYEKEGKEILPHKDLRYRAFELTPYNKVKVVILGQDPYPTKGHADGLAFSVMPHVKPLPRTLQNIITEYMRDLKYPKPHSGDLTPWAKEGVLLLNTALTTLKGKSNAHAKLGWWKLIIEVLCKLNKDHERLVFILWGKQAQEYKALIDTKKHLVITSAHPGPMSARKGFFGSRPFSKANEFLGNRPINWRLQ